MNSPVRMLMTIITGKTVSDTVPVRAIAIAPCPDRVGDGARTPRVFRKNFPQGRWSRQWRPAAAEYRMVL